MTIAMPTYDELKRWSDRLITAAKPYAVSVRARITALRMPLTIAAAAIFIGGAIWSFLRLGLSPAVLNPHALIALSLFAPLSLLHGAIGIVLLAMAVGTSIPLKSALLTAVYASLAEALPLPGGAIVRTGALISSGARIGKSAFLVIVTAVLWISVAATGAGLFLVLFGKMEGLILAIPGVLTVGAVLGWLLVHTGWKVTLLTLAHKLAGILLTAIMLQFAFMAIGVALALGGSLVFAFTTIAGSAAAIAPAGLGISESLSALMAGSVATAPAAAFLAVAIGRIIGLVVTALIAVVAQLAIRNPDKGEGTKGPIS